MAELRIWIRSRVAYQEAPRLLGPVLHSSFGGPTRPAWCWAPRETPVLEVVVPAQQFTDLDSTGADVPTRLAAELQTKHITLAFAEPKMSLRTAIRRNGLEEQIGADNSTKRSMTLCFRSHGVSCNASTAATHRHEQVPGHPTESRACDLASGRICILGRQAAVARCSFTQRLTCR